MARRTAASRKIPLDAFDPLPFLTSFDPSDLPGLSVDPLGFDRGYSLFADKLLPGLTNVGQRPRYLGLLCAGASLVAVDADVPERLEYELRLGCVLRLERLWVLANLLASDDAGLPSRVGIRGALYGRAHLERLASRGEKRTGTDFELLIRQAPYGVVGIYGNIAEGMKLLDRRTLRLTPALGERLGEAFIEETQAPPAVLEAAREPTASVSLAQLEEWGRLAHILAQTGPDEAACLQDALHSHPVRSRMVRLLAEHPYRSSRETELSRLTRVRKALSSRLEDADLREAIDAILAFEACYCWVLLAFERLLWLAKESEVHSVPVSVCTGDRVFADAASALPDAVATFERCVDAAEADAFRQDLQRLSDVRAFLRATVDAVGTSGDVLAFLDQIAQRHDQVQRGKLDRGRPKLPWLERKAASFELTLARVGEASHEPLEPADIDPHAYRVAAADAFLAAAREGEA